MKHKDDLAIDKILECAKAEFMEKGYAEASMRTIAERAGYTTGMVYARFSDKSELFNSLIKDGADKLLACFEMAQKKFTELSPKEQYDQMTYYTEDKVYHLIDIIYDDYDTFKLITCKSGGSRYEDYIDKLIDLETEYTVRFVNSVRGIMTESIEIRADLNHMLASALINGIFEIIRHDLTREEGKKYVQQLRRFFTAGWQEILNH